MKVHVFDTPQAGGATEVEVVGFELLKTPALVCLILEDNLGQQSRAYWREGEAKPLVRAMNKADGSTNPLDQRLLEQAATDGKIKPGSLQEAEG